MSRLTDLVARAKASDPRLGKELEDELQHLMKRQHFGLVFERHIPEAVELPNKPVRPRNKVRVLPPRGSKEKGDPTLWKVQRIVKTGAGRAAELVPPNDEDTEPAILPEIVPLDDLVVVAEVTDTIYPGLVETGRVERGTAEDPYHTVINAENFHALEMLTYTHRHAIDAIYIDPPYNTGDKDWKYNNDYVEGHDEYRHSKWLSMMERRLNVARELLNPENSVLIVTIDEKEYLRLGLLLEQLFPEAHIQMVTSVINPGGSTRTGSFSRTDEYLYFVSIGNAHVKPTPEDMLTPSESRSTSKVQWHSLVRHQASGLRTARPNLFYPIYIDLETNTIREIGQPLKVGEDRKNAPSIDGTAAIFPIYTNGTEGTWGLSNTALRTAVSKGYVRLGKLNVKENRCAVYYLKSGKQKQIENGEIVIVGREKSGAVIVEYPQNPLRAPKSTWNMPSHNARSSGSDLIRNFLPDRSFPFPKSLYAVEDALRFFIADNPDAVILDFFAGSGTTAHAVMRLNRQDAGRRRSISITNNEVSADEQRSLRKQGLRPGDSEWEVFGICDYITKPRVTAAITGKSSTSAPVKGDYRFTDVFPMAEGFEANAAFFTLTYENSLSVAYNKAFEKVAPLLWLRAGAEGRIIGQIPDKGWDVADVYAILEDLDRAYDFTDAVSENERIKIAYIVTDDDRRFQMICRSLPSWVEPVRLYQSYLLNFQLNNGRGVA